ncbi:hypothetical protein [Winogradskya humida]|uniref:Methyl-accepting chemotaxis protein n=1 Tax=Winogradskya humida TaxID=113566 RepID=A0ABQ4A223_9ACTN|nr:hypothetical protein [Actinoplanes humidus]GIE24906.1 hypothetical protein Ahu01nite_080080 [Actinoplanes humidus]
MFLTIPLLFLERIEQRRLTEARRETAEALGALEDHIGQVFAEVEAVSDMLGVTEDLIVSAT